MAKVFTPCAGGVLKHTITTGGGDCGGWAAIQIDNFSSVTVPVTGFALELNTNHQFVHSLNELIYVFSFGDRVGELTMTGLSFVGDCDDAKAAQVTQVFSHYLQKRLAKNLTPAKITVGDAAGGSAQLLGFLTGMRAEMSNPELPIVQWVLRYAVIINDSTGAGGAGPSGVAPPAGGSDSNPADFQGNTVTVGF
jgi:hypothetical protein